MKKLNKKYSLMANIMLVVIMVGLYSIWLASMVSHKERQHIHYVKESKPYIIHDTIYISKEDQKQSNCKDLEYIESELKSLNVKFVDIAVAQSIIESGSYTSDVYTKANNCFGMKLAKQRPTTAIGEYKGYAKYKNIRDCLIDYALWQQNYLSGINTNEDYLKLLERVYAEDKDYINKIKQL
jgi:uncharacterized FlgJ-related protein